MISAKKLRANRSNAKKSTGPRTANGKSRTSRNALRHGLAGTLPSTASQSARVTQIADKLCVNDPFPYRYDEALMIAEMQVLIERIRMYRAAIIVSGNAQSEGNGGLRTLALDQQDQRGFRKALPELARVERYEHRALSRRRRAIRRFDALCDDG
jgi:hypothetical protein